MRAIVIGADGVVGSAIAEMLSQRGDEVWRTTRRSTLVSASRPYLDLAADNCEDVTLPAADIAFFCAAVVTFSECRLNPRLAHRVNVHNTKRLAQRLVSAGTRVVTLSSSAVFDFSIPKVPADHPRSPISKYGEISADAEIAILDLGHGASVLRLTKLFTPKLGTFVTWIDKLSRGETITAFSDIHIAPMTVDDIVAGVRAILGDPSGGIYQVSGATDVSYYDIALEFADRLGISRTLVVEGSAVAIGIPREEVPLYASLDTSRVTALTGWRPPSPQAVIDKVFRAALERAQGSRGYV